MDLAKEKIGSEGGFDVKVEQGKVKLKLSYDGKGADASVEASVEVGYFLDKLKEAIPGEIDDKVIDVIKLAMLAS